MSSWRLYLFLHLTNSRFSVRSAEHRPTRLFGRVLPQTTEPASGRRPISRSRYSSPPSLPCTSTFLSRDSLHSTELPSPVTAYPICCSPATRRRSRPCYLTPCNPCCICFIFSVFDNTFCLPSISKGNTSSAYLHPDSKFLAIAHVVGFYHPQPDTNSVPFTQSVALTPLKTAGRRQPVPDKRLRGLVKESSENRTPWPAFGLLVIAAREDFDLEQYHRWSKLSDTIAPNDRLRTSGSTSARS